MKDEIKDINKEIIEALDTMAQQIAEMTATLKEINGKQEEEDKNKITVGDVVQNDNCMRFVVTKCGTGPNAVCDGISKYGDIMAEYAHELKKTGEHIYLIDEVLALLKEDDE